VDLAIQYSGEEKEIILPDGITYIPKEQFSGNTNLERVVIPGSVRVIREHAFHHCLKLKNIEIPEGVVTIEEGAFTDCKRLQKVTLPDSLRKIGWYAFSNCVKLETINIPEGVDEFGPGTFGYCSSLSSVKLPESLTIIRAEEAYPYLEEYGPFEKCKSLKSITIPQNVMDIGYRAFAYCTSLESIEIRGNVDNIHINAFRDCPVKSFWVMKGIKEFGRHALEFAFEEELDLFYHHNDQVGDGFLEYWVQNTNLVDEHNKRIGKLLKAEDITGFLRQIDLRKCITIYPNMMLFKGRTVNGDEKQHWLIFRNRIPLKNS
jgi:hypothetical protein